MSATTELTAQLRAEVLRLEDDLRERLTALTDRDTQWRGEHSQALAKQRTAASWEEWRDERITQVAVAWVLTTVFVRFCEDNGLLKQVWISGPGVLRQQALDAQQQFLRETARTNPDVTDREWLLDAVQYLRGLKATANLVDDTSPLWQLSPSGDAATHLLDFWRARADDGTALRDLVDPQLDTRFLGDLYQDLSIAAQKRYALLQTPVFVEEFILDRTLEPSLAERPLEGFKLIDPTCGSGHFLLGAFTRLLDRWHTAAPGMDERERVQKALDSIYGVDLNPFAVAIARFRLTVAALQAGGLTSLENAPAFEYHLAVGDSLLFGVGERTLLGDADLHDFAYSTEDVTVLESILADGQYDAVVGNPPYITVKDKALNAEYRRRYKTCKGTYALTVPFMERFFRLAKPGDTAGWTGQITSNSFMKREFGGPLIETFLPTKDLRLVADTSGAYIPGHGTPTVIIAGRNQRPIATAVRAILGVRGEPGRPDDPAKGKVWSSIVEHVDDPTWSDEWITVTDLDRTLLESHPWSLTGGGAVELKTAIEASASRLLREAVAEIGFGAVTREDSAYMVGGGALRRHRIEGTHQRPIVEGDVVRDFRIVDPIASVWPYNSTSLEAEADDSILRFLWPYRSQLVDRVAYGLTQIQRGLQWFEYSMFFTKRYRISLSIAFAFVATHNHFVLDRGGNVFKQSAPVIKLPEGATEDDHLALLGVLNSSTACFWLKQNSHNKGEGGGARVDAGYAARGEAWRDTYEFTGTTLQDYPLPTDLPLHAGLDLDALAQRLAGVAPEAVSTNGVPTRAGFDAARGTYEQIRAQMIQQQEDLDWHCYRLYGLIDNELVYGSLGLPGIELGQRAFEIVLARRIAADVEDSTWFTHPAQTVMPITELPAGWPDDYRVLVERRIALIESHPFIRLLERPEYKRRWAGESWEKQEERALRDWLLDRLEDKGFWFDQAGRPVPRSVMQLADLVSRDSDLTSVLALWEGRPDVPVATSLERLLADQAVPYLAALRYKDSGLRKREAWERTWALQRREDAGEKLAAPIPVPPKYTTADFVRTSYWSHRGKLDVPKERFILYPNAGRDTDPTPLLGWAGWDHAQQSLALATLIQQRQGAGWADERLVPLVAGLAELLPWVRQWHHEPDPFYGGTSPADFFTEQLTERAAQVQHTVDELAAWRPEPATRGRRRRTTS